MKEKVKEIITNACALKEEVTFESEIRTLSIDSLSFVEAIVALEEAFEIEFDIDELGILDWRTVEDIAKSVEEKIRDKK